MKLPPLRLLLLFAIGAFVAPFGDHGHVASGTTQYFPTSTPFIWDGPFWFPILVGLATAANAELRLHLPAPRATLTVGDGVAGIAAVMGLYALTALLRHQPLVPSTLVVVALAVLAWHRFGDKPALVCAVATAVGGVAVEAALVAAGVFRYADDIDILLGVAPWLPALYFVFGIVSAQLGEIAAKV
ncbi:hypothetical protein LVJ94_50850 [Pendulispora rubella]|uniref:Uncharacterized protein n=1 Tax=Pendulispora rubella TaxID=2741070 RepID=A0ABZ2L2K0_9BACT